LLNQTNYDDLPDEKFKNQKVLAISGEEFFIDLLLFHRELQCLVAIELKAGAFKPEYKWKMESLRVCFLAKILGCRNLTCLSIY
jgi:hypothetical protein